MGSRSDSVRFNPLLECLVILTKLYKRPFSSESLTAGLPVEEGQSTPILFSIDHAKSEFSRAAARAGLTSRLVRKELTGISSMVLPVILLLKEGNAAILTGFDTNKKHAKIIIPELGEDEQWIGIEDLKSEYLGFSFYIKKVLVEPEREEAHRALLPVKKRHWFWSTLKYSADIYRDAILASFLINLFVLATPMFTMNVYDRVVPNGATETLWVLAIGVLVIFVFDTILKFTRSYFLEIAGKKNEVIMSSILFEKVMDIKMDFYPKSIGSFANHLKEFSSISSFFTSATLSVLIDLPFVLIFLLTIYYIAGQIVIVPIVTILLILLYTIIIKKPLQESIESSYESSARKYGVLIESLSNLETLKTLGAIGQTQWKWEESSGDIAQKGIKTRIYSNSIITVTSLLIQVNIVALLIVGVYLIGLKELTMGGLIATVILASRAIAPMAQVAGLISNYEHVKTTYKTLNEIMQLPVERPENKKFIHRPGLMGKIEFKNVSFTYPDDEKIALDDVSFVIEPGEKVAIIGKVGGGKTTIEKLILGLYSASEGSVLLDDIEIGQIDPVDVRKSIGYVPQEVSLFKGSLKENVIYKAPDATDSQILQACEISGVTSFVNRHPKGFDMQIGERGMGLSGGQIQCIGLARALMVNTPIYLFDEPTNSIDGTAESKLLKRLKTALKEKTVLIVTHKTSLLELVDRVLVLDDGKIVLDGKKEMVLNALKRH